MNGMTEAEIQALAAKAAAVRAYWSGRLDGLCAELESKGFRIQREGLTVRIDLPAPPETAQEVAAPAPAPVPDPDDRPEAEREGWQGSSL